MNLPKMLFNDLEPQDFFGLKILKNGFNPEFAPLNKESQDDDDKHKQLSNKYLQDVIVLEEKKMNTIVKVKHLEDFMNNDLKDYNKNNMRYGRLTGKDAQMSNFEMRRQTVLAIERTINRIKNIDEFTVEEVHGEEIKGPMRWIILILGPNHHARNLNSVINNEYKNLNIIVVFITNTNKS